MTEHRKRLIEVALPLEAINRESAREKSIRHGHPSTLHLWWARRPLAACRAVIFGQLVEGEDVREAISGVEVVDADGPDNIPNNGDDDNRPVEDVVMQDVEIFVDEENGVMMLKAAEGLTGSTTVTVLLPTSAPDHRERRDERESSNAESVHTSR